jgi:hypothetical protein
VLSAPSGCGRRRVELLEREAAVVVGEDLEDVLRHGAGAPQRLGDVLHRGEQLLLAVLRHQARVWARRAAAVEVFEMAAVVLSAGQ